MPKMYKQGFKEKITYENMYNAYLQARKSKRYKKDVILFNLRYEERLILMCEKLKRGIYDFGKFKEFIGAQGGNVETIEDVSLLPTAKVFLKYNAKKSGYISKIEAEKLGIASMMLGGGRAKKTDSIDYGVGIVLDKKLGDFVKEGEPLLTLHINNEDKVDEVMKLLDSAYEYENEEVKKEELIAEVIG